MAEFKNCGRGALDRFTFYGHHGDSEAVAKVLTEIKECPKYAQGIECGKRYCEGLHKKGILDKAAGVADGTIPCTTKKDLFDVLEIE